MRALERGRRFDKYEIVRHLAMGGMGELYLARAKGIEGFEKLVALKRIQPDYALDRRFIQMFLDEARTAATLHHPNVAQVHDFGKSEGTYFFTMEYIHGIDLRRLLRTVYHNQLRVPLEHALMICANVAAGLHYAHEKTDASGKPLGLVHRDVSPSNVVIGFDGSVKLVDFGVAKATSRAGETRSYDVKGKLRYMSPEQARAEPLDRRSDVFSLGLLLYQLTTGEAAYEDDVEISLVPRVAKGEVVPPSERVENYSRELESLVMRALSPNRDERFASAQDFQLAIETFAFEHRVQLSQVRLANYTRDLFREEAETRVEGDEPSRSGERPSEKATAALSDSNRREKADEKTGETLATTGTLSIDSPRRLPPAAEEITRKRRRFRKTWAAALVVGATLVALAVWETRASEPAHRASALAQPSTWLTFYSSPHERPLFEPVLSAADVPKGKPPRMRRDTGNGSRNVQPPKPSGPGSSTFIRSGDL